VVVRDFDFIGIAAPPVKTDSVAIDDANTVLSAAVSAQTLQPVTRRDSQFLQLEDAVQWTIGARPRLVKGCQIANGRLAAPVDSIFGHGSIVT
jgi:hypothetical protein